MEENLQQVEILLEESNFFIVFAQGKA